MRDPKRWRRLPEMSARKGPNPLDAGALQLASLRRCRAMPMLEHSTLAARQYHEPVHRGAEAPSLSERCQEELATVCLLAPQEHLCPHCWTDIFQIVFAQRNVLRQF